MAHAEGTFHNDSWKEEVVQKFDDGSKVTLARIVQDFEGDLVGMCSWASVMAYRPDGTAEYTGFLRLVGRLGRRHGTFIVQADGAYDGDRAKITWRVVSGTGTEELRGLQGAGTAEAPHGPDGTYSFDYEVG
jgi:hypothetical protein